MLFPLLLWFAHLFRAVFGGAALSEMRGGIGYKNKCSTTFLWALSVMSKVSFLTFERKKHTQKMVSPSHWTRDFSGSSNFQVGGVHFEALIKNTRYMRSTMWAVLAADISLPALQHLCDFLSAAYISFMCTFYTRFVKYEACKKPVTRTQRKKRKENIKEVTEKKCNIRKNFERDTAL